jgi:hypothetical protein
MRSFTPLFLLASTGLVFSALFAGCGDGLLLTPSNTTASSTIVSVGSGLSSCNNGAPNGECNPSGNYPEDCECSDCEATAVCTGKCVDDNVCAFNPDTYDGTGEDCSCPDCYYKVNFCAPYPCDQDGNCECDTENPACTVQDSCVCNDCLGSPACNNCLDNGVCTPINESCACADCANDIVCGGQGPASSSSSSSGMGGSGGSPGTGGAGGVGGIGGAGGVGGAGGA